MSRGLWWLGVVLGWLVAGYAVATALLGDRVYPPDLAASFNAHPWAITTHAFFGAVAMLLGPWQFRRTPVFRREWHRWLGRVYLAACGLSGGAGLHLAFYSFAGVTTNLGFGGLAIALLGTTTAGYLAIRGRAVVRHREWMVRSYALIFAAVTLRIELPILTAAFGDFTPAYRVIAWLCWVPNLLVAEWFLRRRRVGATDLPAPAVS
jgi:hypothetical protein